MRKAVMAMVLTFSLLGVPGVLRAQAPAEKDCQETVSLLKAQENKLSGELRRIQREIAALRADFNKPGLDDIISGFGYILGIFGTAAWVASRRRKE